MTEQTLRRSNWSPTNNPPRPSDTLKPLPPMPEDDPLAELERIVSRGEPRPRPPVLPDNVELFPQRAGTAAPPAADAAGRIEPTFEMPALSPAPASAPPLPPSGDDFLGVDVADFEAALRGPLAPEPALPAPAPARVDPVLAMAAAPPEDGAAQPLSAQPLSAHALSAQELDAQFLRDLDRELFGEPEQAEAAPAVADVPAAEPRRRSAAVTAFAVVGVILVGGAGAVAFKMFNAGATRTAAGQPVVVRADARPTRVVPEPTQQQQDQAGKAIYDRLAQSPPATAERVVPREEQPVEQLQQQIEARPPTTAQAPAGASEPRRVTTTTIRVRPDGTLESEPTRTASLPPVIAAPPIAPPAAAPPLSSVVQPASPAPSAPAAPAPVAATRAPAVATPPTRPAAPPARTETANAAPLALAPAATTPPRPAAEPAARVASAGNGAFVQVTSQRSEQAARDAYATLQRRYPAVLGGREPNIRAVDLGERGTFYRARVGGFSSRDDAAAFCQRLRGAGGDCVLAAN